jgi:hypothetical protein
LCAGRKPGHDVSKRGSPRNGSQYGCSFNWPQLADAGDMFGSEKVEPGSATAKESAQYRPVLKGGDVVAQVDEAGACSYSRNLIGEVAEWSKAALC